jgi:hypothetical protein
VVLDILERRVVGQVLEERAYFVLGSLQLDLPNFTLPRLTATGQSVCPAWRYTGRSVRRVHTSG